MFESPAIVWQGMSMSEIEKELQSLKKRQTIINRFVTHLKNCPECDYSEYEQFCDSISTEGVDPILWIEGAIENVELAIENAV